MLNPEDVPPEEKEAYEKGREYGRYEIDNMITWNVNCLGCAAGLDKMYNERYAGYRDGIKECIAAVEGYTSERPFKSFVIKKLHDLLSP